MLPYEKRSEVCGSSGEKETTNPFLGKDFISVDQIASRKEIEYLFSVADKMKERIILKKTGDELKESTVAILFYQPSTRTFSSFLAAAQWLGCSRVIDIHGMGVYSSAVKGESLRDTIRTIEATTAADLIVLRHPDDDSSRIAAEVASVPVINGGSGREEHPTQAILDLYSIREELGRIDDLVVTMIGDLRNGRTIKSLAKLLALSGRDVKFNFLSPEALRMPEKIIASLKSRGTEVLEENSDRLESILEETDVLYVTRVQSEWFVKQTTERLKTVLLPEFGEMEEGALIVLAKELAEKEYRKAVEGYVIDSGKLGRAKNNTRVMHPFPRLGEIAYEVDKDPRAAYFRQMRNGLYTRMALLATVLGKV